MFIFYFITIDENFDNGRFVRFFKLNELSFWRFLFDLGHFFKVIIMILKFTMIFNGYFLNFDILRLNPLNFIFEMTNFLAGPIN